MDKFVKLVVKINNKDKNISENCVVLNTTGNWNRELFSFGKKWGNLWDCLSWKNIYIYIYIKFIIFSMPKEIMKISLLIYLFIYFYLTGKN